MVQDVTEYSLNDKLPANIYAHREFVLDQYCTGLIRNTPSPRRNWFAVMNGHKFAAQFRERKGRMKVLIERRGTDQPGEAWVSFVDGNIIGLKSPLNFDPAEGACVQLLLGYKTKYIDLIGAERIQKEEEEVRWI